VIAIIHEREAGGPPHFDLSIAQGDPIDRPSRHVPRGRGPFDTFLAAAIDALVHCAPFAARWKDWSPGGTLCLFITYNGEGYWYRGETSPYDYGATNEEERGKFDGDNHYNAALWDMQIGCAAMIKGLMALDPTIEFGPEPADSPAEPPPEAPTKPAPPQEPVAPPAPAPAPGAGGGAMTQVTLPGSTTASVPVGKVLTATALATPGLIHDFYWVQRALNVLQDAGLKVDNDPGEKTRAAVEAFQKARGMRVDGAVTVPVIRAIIAALQQHKG